MFRQNSGAPFEEEPFVKAHYCPSLQKQLSTSQKKTCLSPNKETDHPKGTSKADAKFLRESNKLSSHEHPTREDGTLQDEVSFGSKFNESWPSTDKNISSSPQNTLLSSSTPAEKDISFMETSNKYRHEDKHLRPSTLSKYVERFRHGAPTSRKDRHSSDTSTSGKDFWWLSQPSDSSTPKYHSGSTTSKFNVSSESSSKLGQNTTYESPQRQKYRFKRNQFSRPVRETVEGLGSRSADLLAKTNQLLKTSGNTLSELSSDSIPKPPSSWMIEKQKRLDTAVRTKTPSVVKSCPPPEDDILYQWRLARRLEKAQEEAKASHVKYFANTETRHPADLTRARYSAYLPEQDHPRFHKDSKYRNNDSKSNDKIYFNEVSRQVNVIMNPTTDDMPMHAQENFQCRKKNQESNQVAPLESNVESVCFINNENLPPHVHMMCDIVPCSKMNLKPDLKHDVNVEQKYPNASNFSKHIVECGQKNREVYDLPDIHDDPDHLQTGSNITTDNIDEKPRSRGLNSANQSRTASEEKRKELTNTRDEQYSCDKSKSISNIEQPRVNDLETPQDVLNSRTSEIRTNGQNDLRFKEKQDSKDLTIPDETTKARAVNKPPTAVKEISSRGQTKKHVLSNVAKHPDDSGSRITEDKEDIGAVIGQVISERLFCSMSSSHRSSISSCSISTEDEDVEQGKNVDLTSKQCENHVEQERRVAEMMTEEVPFSDDDILIRLREQAHFYREHLRNINKILETFDT